MLKLTLLMAVLCVRYTEGQFGFLSEIAGFETGGHTNEDDVLCGAPEMVDSRSSQPIHFKPAHFQQHFGKVCHTDESRRFRTADGSCNHLWNLGSAATPLRRMLPPVYDDMVNSPRNHARNGYKLPASTLVSRAIHSSSDDFNSRSVMFMQWGQFIDHDIALSPLPTEEDSNLRCCVNGEIPGRLIHKDCMPIELDAEDNRFQNRCMEFVRSIAAIDATGRMLIPREQTNSLTAFVDGSMIYGSSEELQHELREETRSGVLGALLRTEEYGNDFHLLPESEEEDCIITNRRRHHCFLAGDIRVNEHPGLAVMHTIWVRLHNIIARGLDELNAYDLNSRDEDEQEELFQVSRKIVIGILQNILYKEWLPLVVGEDHMRAYDLLPIKRVGYSGHVDPRITNAFSTAAYRFGHSLIPASFNISGTSRTLSTLFNRPDLVFDDFDGVVTAWLSPSRQGQAQTFDRHLVDEVTDKLFEDAPRTGLDLAALNIQRGRDHGLPPFNEFRKVCGLEPFRNFSQFGADVAADLQDIYNDSIDDVELFTGGLLEEPVETGRVGPTFACIISQQFHALKFGDRFYFETKRMPEGFTDDQLASIRNVTFAQVICNTTGVDRVQEEAFHAPRGQDFLSCDMVRKRDIVDFSLWEEESLSRRRG